MIGSAQILLIVVIVILTITLVVLGVQSFLILRDLRKALNKTNTFLDTVKSGSSIARIIGAVGALVIGKKFGKNFIDLIYQPKDEKNLEEPQKNKLIVKVEPPQKPIRRFFRRSK